MTGNNLRAGREGAGTNPAKFIISQINRLSRVAADAVELIRRGRDYAEPVTVLPDRRNL